MTESEQPQQREERWMPLSVRNDPERAAAFDVLHEGVPQWLRDPLLGWIYREIGNEHAIRTQSIDNEWRGILLSNLRKDIPQKVGDINNSDYLDVIDCVISVRLRYRNIRHQEPWPDQEPWLVRLRDLERILRDGGSVWQVDVHGLTRRVNETQQRLVSDVLATKTPPAQYLGDAWRKAWGRNPDASGAYGDAVRAVEAAYRSIVSPDNERTTLGTIINDIENKPQKFGTRLQPRNDRNNAECIAGMMRMLWEGQRDRHGTDDPDTPLSLEEAQDAVVLAVTLVHFAQQGGFESSNRG